MLKEQQKKEKHVLKKKLNVGLNIKVVIKKQLTKQFF